MEPFASRRRLNLTWPLRLGVSILLAHIALVAAQQECYFGPGAEYRGPVNLVPCNATGTSTCCLLGDTCLSGNTCYNYATGDLYQYGCTDITYQDVTCPRKCGWDPALSPWTALEYCTDIQDLDDTWVCHAPESCGCAWNSTYDLLVLQPIGCKEMGDNARVALYAPSTLAPYVSLPSKIGGSTGYYSPLIVSGTSTWVSTAVAGYTPTPFTQLTTYRAAPTAIVQIASGQTAAPLTYSAARSFTPVPTTPQNSTAGGAAPPTTSTAAYTSSMPTKSAIPSAAESSRLSTGSKVGIGVGVAAGAIVLGLLAWAAFVSRRNHRNRQSQAEPLHGQYQQSPPLTHYSQSPPMPYYSHSPPMQQYSGGPTPIQGSHWGPYPVQVDAAGQPLKPQYSPGTSPPAELSVDGQRTLHEIGSDVSTGSPPASSPGHGYSERL